MKLYGNSCILKVLLIDIIELINVIIFIGFRDENIFNRVYCK